MLENLRLRHSMLSSLFHHAKNYNECMEREYFGPRSPQEKLLCQKINDTLAIVEKTMSDYKQEQANILE